MKKVFAVLMCVVILCMTMCITAFAAESDPIIIEKEIVNGQSLENGHTYVFEYYPWTQVDGSAKSQVSIVKNDGVEVVYFNRYISSAVSTLYAVQASNSTMGAGNTVICVNKNYKDAWTSDCFNFNVSSTSQIVAGKLVVISMTVPDDGNVYNLSIGEHAEITDLRVYERVVHTEHVYTNTCDTYCNECNYQRSITHTYLNDDDHNCSICGYVNPDPTHVYDNSCDVQCNLCTYERVITHTYKNHVCTICGHEQPAMSLIESLAFWSMSVFSVATISSAWMISDALVQLAITLTVISVVAYVLLKLYRRF